MYITNLTKALVALIITAATTASNAQVFKDGEWQGSDIQKGNPHNLAPEVLHRSPVPCTVPLGTSQRSWHLPTATWLNNTVPYTFEPDVSLANRTAMINAMGELTRVTYIKFIERTTQTDYVLIQESDVNSSNIGRVGGEQIINIVSWNFEFVMVHELMHAIGVWHEQSAIDRNKYVFINEVFILPDALHNFDIHADGFGSRFYDYESVMHYGQWAFSISPFLFGFETIITNDSDFQDVIGQREYISEQDDSGLDYMLGSDTLPTEWLNVDYAIPFPLFPAGIFEAPWISVGQAVLQASSGDRIVNITPRTDTTSASPEAPLVINKFVVIEGAPLTIE